MELNYCSIGQSMKGICHTTKFTRKSGMESISELESDELDLIQMCCLSVSTNVCLHHEQMYIHKYSNWQVTCRNPTQLHKKIVAYKYLKTLNFSEAQAVNNLHI